MKQNKTDLETRDMFAAAALTGLLINPNSNYSLEDCSFMSFDIAKKMMKARNAELNVENKKLLKHVFLEMAARCNTVEDEQGCINCDLFNQISKGGGCKYAMEGSCTNRHKLIFKYRK